jgi:ankyrin repeat protein
VDASGLLEAIRRGDSDAVRSALRDDPALALARDQSGVSAICLAVYLGRDDIARELARTRDDLDVFEASTLGEVGRVRELVASSPELANACSPDGFHPLGYACFFGREPLVELLLDANADLEAPARNAMQVRPLHSAVAHSDPTIALSLAARLLEAGASPNVTQQNGFTPLHEAALRGHAELVRLLLRNHADPSARNSEGCTPADLARQHGHAEVLEVLELAV